MVHRGFSSLAQSSLVFRASSFVGEGGEPLSNRQVTADANDLLAYAQSQQQRGNIQEAMAVYSQLSAETETTAAIPDNIRRQAQRALNAITGGDGFTASRAEYLANRTMEGLFDLPSLGAMMGAGLTYRFARFGLLRILNPVACPVRGALFAGSALGRLGPTALKGLATGGAFALEASLFPVYGRLGAMALGREVDWSSHQLAHDVQSSFFILGGLKLFGFGGNRLLRGWQQNTLATGGLVPKNFTHASSADGHVFGYPLRPSSRTMGRPGTGNFGKPNDGGILHHLGPL